MSSAAAAADAAAAYDDGGGDGGDRDEGGGGGWCGDAARAMRCCSSCCGNAGAAHLPRVTFAIPTQTPPCRLTRKRLHCCSNPSEKQALMPGSRRCIIRRVFGKRF
jgi:hypothetical protein